jgi:hypothetical protein
MCPPWAAPPAAETCLVRAYSSRPTQKGGTWIAEHFVSLSAYLAALSNADLLRPPRCVSRGCTCGGLHVKERRERRPRQLVVDGKAVPAVVILIFECATCAATWRVLPAFLARCLWRTWDVIARELSGAPPGSAPPVPRRTVRRWRARLVQTARQPVQVLAVAGGALRGVAQRLGLDCSRAQLLAGYAAGVGALSVLLHRLAPGVRLM